MHATNILEIREKPSWVCFSTMTFTASRRCNPQAVVARGASAVPLVALLVLLCLGRLRLDIIAPGVPALLRLRSLLKVNALLGVRLHLVI